MTIRKPIDATHDVRVSIQDIIDELASLKKQIAMLPQANLQSREIDNLKQAVNKVSVAATTFAPEDVFRGAGPAHAMGAVPDPGAPPVLPGFERYLREDGTWHAIFEPFMFTNDRSLKFNIPGHVHVAGGIYASRLVASRITDMNPLCIMKRNADFNHNSTGNWLKVPIDTVLEDTDSMADVTNNKIVIKTPGLYRVSALGNFASVALGPFDIYVSIYKGGVGCVYSSGRTSTTNAMWLISTRLIRLAVNEYLELYAYQNTGGNSNMAAAVDALQLAVELVK